MHQQRPRSPLHPASIHPCAPTHPPSMNEPIRTASVISVCPPASLPHAPKHDPANAVMHQRPVAIAQSEVFPLGQTCRTGERASERRGVGRVQLRRGSNHPPRGRGKIMGVFRCGAFGSHSRIVPLARACGRRPAFLDAASLCA